MLNGLLGLRHDAVVGRHDQDHDVGGLGAARPHCCEGRMARRIEEGHDPAIGLHVVGADVLRDAACLTFHDMRVTYVVQQRGLAVVDMAHHGDDRRPRNALADVLLFLGNQLLLDVLLFGGLGRVPHFLDHENRRVLVETLIDGDHDAHLHQHLDHFGGLDGHLLGEVGHGDGLGHLHLAGDGGRRLGKAVLRRPARAGGADPGPRPAAARRGALGHMQFLASVPGLRLALFLFAPALLLGQFTRTLLFLAALLVLGAAARLLLLRLLLGLATRLFLGFLAGHFQGRLTGLLFLLETRLFGDFLPGAFLGLPGSARFFENPARLLALRGLGPDLLLDDFALDVGAALANLDVHRPGRAPRTRTRHAQLADRLSLERDLAGRRSVAFHLAVAGAQVGQQLLLVFVGDRVVAAAGLDPGVIQLRKQALAVHTKNVSQL